MIVPFMPERRRFGPRCSTKLRAVVEAMFYIASTGCQWRQLPKDFPPYSTVQGYFYGNRCDRLTWTLVATNPSLRDLRMGGVGRWIMPLLVPCISTGMIAMSIAGSS